MYRVRRGLRDCWSSSFKLDIQWAGYSANLAFMSYFVIKVSFRIIFVLSTSLVARSNKMRLCCLVR